MHSPSQHFASSRRRFLQQSGAAGLVLALPTASAKRRDRARDRFAGVGVGAITYSYRELPSSAEQLLGYLVQGGFNRVELMGDAAEEFAGSPPSAVFPALAPGAQPTQEQIQGYLAERVRVDEERAKWRPHADLNRYRQLRKMYADAGVHIDILKLGEATWSDADIDYAYAVAGILGARAISFELEDAAAKRLGAFATRHRLLNGMHNHLQYGQPGFSPEPMLAHSKYNALNFDIGHYVASTGKSPVEFIRQHHARITHLHLKDRKRPENGADNVAWGTGDTPIGEVLRLLRDEHYPITAMVELEYPVPTGSDVLTEVRKCADFCAHELHAHEPG